MALHKQRITRLFEVGIHESKKTRTWTLTSFYPILLAGSSIFAHSVRFRNTRCLANTSQKLIPNELRSVLSFVLLYSTKIAFARSIHSPQVVPIERTRERERENLLSPFLSIV